MLDSTAPAGLLATAAADSSSTMGIAMNILPLVLIFVVFYFLLIRPQQQRLKAHKEMVANVRRGDVVVTGGGMIGKITRVSDDEATVELAENVRVRVLRSTITEVRAKTEPAPANDSDGD
jgi:preprotein translocase subunit YajC